VTNYTGELITDCKACASQITFRLDERWEYVEDVDGYVKQSASRHMPKFCPACGSSEVEVREEALDFWLYCARVADWKVSPESIALMKQLHTTWLTTKHGFFTELLKDFKQSVVNSRQTPKECPPYQHMDPDRTGQCIRCGRDLEGYSG
jgi:hypothetical protein